MHKKFSPSDTASGFTLVELAIALMVIGLLIAGVLKGQELVNNARVTQTTRQITAFNTAINIFYGTYNARPGDIKTPGTRIPNCTTPSCNTPGNGNGRYTASYTGPDDGEGVTNTTETRTFWVHLAKANMITGISPDAAWTGTTSWGVEFPEAAVGGGFGVLGFTFMNSGGTPPVTNANAFSIRGVPGTDTMVEPDGNPAAMSPTQAAQIDRKLDDGKPLSGDVQINWYVPECLTGNDYNEASTSGPICNLVAKTAM